MTPATLRSQTKPSPRTSGQVAPLTRLRSNDGHGYPNKQATDTPRYYTEAQRSTSAQAVRFGCSFQSDEVSHGGIPTSPQHLAHGGQSLLQRVTSFLLYTQDACWTLPNSYAYAQHWNCSAFRCMTLHGLLSQYAHGGQRGFQRARSSLL